MNRKERSVQGGFSLVEMVIAMALVGFAFLTMGKLMLASSEHSKQGRHDMIALQHAQMHSLRGHPAQPLHIGRGAMRQAHLLARMTEMQNPRA